jgi:hypothetical protein
VNVRQNKDNSGVLRRSVAKKIIQVVIRQCSSAQLRFSSSQSAPLQGFPLALAARPRLGRMYVRARLPFIYAAWDDATMAG